MVHSVVAITWVKVETVVESGEDVVEEVVEEDVGSEQYR